MKGAYRLIDLFSGMGCASLGFKKAGFKLATALEIDPLRCKIYKTNLGVKPIRSDVMKVTGRQLLKRAKLRKGDNFVIVGCPPCQSFSKLADTSGVDVLRDPRSKYVNKFAELVEETRPLAVVFENVPWMVKGPGKKFFRRYLERLEAAGYWNYSGTVNAANFGVPQNRLRVIAISIRKEYANEKAKKIIENLYRKVRKSPKTVRDVIKDLKPLRVGQKDDDDQFHAASLHSPKVMAIIKNVPKNGGSRRDLPKSLWLECHKKIKHGADSVYGRMSWDKPSPTITSRCSTPACGRFIHPTQSRGITIREAARLQTIPDDFYLDGFRHELESMIGDAVPVRLARSIARTLMKALP